MTPRDTTLAIADVNVAIAKLLKVRQILTDVDARETRLDPRLRDAKHDTLIREKRSKASKPKRARFKP